MPHREERPDSQTPCNSSPSGSLWHKEMKPQTRSLSHSNNTIQLCWMNELIPQVQCEWGRPKFLFEKTVLDIMGKRPSQSKPDLMPSVPWAFWGPNGTTEFFLVQLGPLNSHSASEFVARISDSIPYVIRIKWICIWLLQLHSIHTRL